MVRLVSFFIVMFWPVFSYSLSFNLDKNTSLIGYYQIAQVRLGEDFSDVALRFGVGYYEMLEANPGVDPNEPKMGTVLVVPTQYILPSELKRDSMVINLAEMRLYFLPKNGSKVYIFPVGIGREDWQTPQGEMSIVQKTKNPTWYVPDSIYQFRKSIGDKIKRAVPPGPDNPLGKYSLRLSNRKYLIHGTNFVPGVGRRSTAGCVRLYNQDIEQLYNLVSVGTKVFIINKPYKAKMVGKSLYLEAHMPLFEDRIEQGNSVQPALDVVMSITKGERIKIDWSKVRKIAEEHLTLPRLVD